MTYRRPIDRLLVAQIVSASTLPILVVLLLLMFLR
jgi:hypothetical protein